MMIRIRFRSGKDGSWMIEDLLGMIRTEMLSSLAMTVITGSKF